MKTSLIIFLLLLYSAGSKAQLNFHTYNDNKRTIEVTGKAEMEIIPDEIYVSITLRERYESKVKLTLDKQEDSLKKKLMAIGIDLKNLTLSDATSDYVRVHWRKKDALNSKDYQLKLSTAEEVSKVFQALGELKIDEANIYKVDHSKLEEYKKDLRIKAVKDAKDKATYMLASINELPGVMTDLVELGASDYDKDEDISGWKNIHYYNSVGYDRAEADSNGNSASSLYPEVEFQKIKLNYQVQATFEIK